MAHGLSLHRKRFKSIVTQELSDKDIVLSIDYDRANDKLLHNEWQLVQRTKSKIFTYPLQMKDSLVGADERGKVVLILN